MHKQSDKFHEHVKKAAKDCKKIITISNHNKDEVNKILSEYKQKVITISNGYDKSVFYKENCNKKELLSEFFLLFYT